MAYEWDYEWDLLVSDLFMYQNRTRGLNVTDVSRCNRFNWVKFCDDTTQPLKGWILITLRYGVFMSSVSDLNSALTLQGCVPYVEPCWWLNPKWSYIYFASLWWRHNWAWWHLKSPASPLFTQQFIQVQIKETSELRVTGLSARN